MAASPLANSLVAFSYPQEVSKTGFIAAGPLADGLLAFACSQAASEPVS